MRSVHRLHISRLNELLQCRISAIRSVSILICCLIGGSCANIPREGAEFIRDLNDPNLQRPNYRHSADDDGVTLVGSAWKTPVYVWSGRKLEQRELLEGAVGPSAISPDGGWIAAMHDRSIGLWKRGGNTPSVLLEESSEARWWRLEFMGDGKHIWAHNDHYFWIWRVATGKLIQRIEDFSINWSSVAVSHDGNWVSTNGQGSVSIWNAMSAKQIGRIELSEHGGDRAWRGEMMMAFNSNGTRLLITNGIGGWMVIRVRRDEAGYSLEPMKHRQPPVSCRALTFLPKKSTVLLAGGNEITIFDLETETVLEKRTLNGPLKSLIRTGSWPLIWYGDRSIVRLK